MSGDDWIVRHVVRAQERDEDAFADLVEATREKLVRRIRRHGLQQVDAEAVAFSVYREAWQSMTRLREPSRFESWIGVIARRKASDEAKRDRLRQLPLEEYDEANLAQLAGNEAEDEDETLSRRREALEQLFAGLSDDDRRLLEAKYLDRVTIAEIARLTGLKIHQIKHRLKKLKERLRRQRSGETEADPEDEDSRAKAPGNDVRSNHFGVVTPAGKRGSDE